MGPELTSPKIANLTPCYKLQNYKKKFALVTYLKQLETKRMRKKYTLTYQITCRLSQLRITGSSSRNSTRQMVVTPFKSPCSQLMWMQMEMEMDGNGIQLTIIFHNNFPGLK